MRVCEKGGWCERNKTSWEAKRPDSSPTSSNSSPKLFAILCLPRLERSAPTAPPPPALPPPSALLPSPPNAEPLPALKLRLRTDSSPPPPSFAEECECDGFDTCAPSFTPWARAPSRWGSPVAPLLPLLPPPPLPGGGFLGEARACCCRGCGRGGTPSGAKGWCLQVGHVQKPCRFCVARVRHTRFYLLDYYSLLRVGDGVGMGRLEQGHLHFTSCRYRRRRSM